jgi:hypothetical protein
MLVILHAALRKNEIEFTAAPANDDHSSNKNFLEVVTYEKIFRSSCGGNLGPVGRLRRK